MPLFTSSAHFDFITELPESVYELAGKKFDALFEMHERAGKQILQTLQAQPELCLLCAQIGAFPSRYYDNDYLCSITVSKETLPLWLIPFFEYLQKQKSAGAKIAMLHEPHSILAISVQHPKGAVKFILNAFETMGESRQIALRWICNNQDLFDE